MDKRVYFEKITISNIALFFYYKVLGYNLYSINFLHATGDKPSKLARRYGKKKWLKSHLALARKPHGLAISQANIIVDKLSKEELGDIFKNVLYCNREVFLILKKVLVKELFKTIYINELFRRLSLSDPNTKIILVPSSYLSYKKMLEKYSNYQFYGADNIRFFKLFEPFFLIKSFFFKSSLLLMLTFFFCIKFLNIIKHKKYKETFIQKFKYALYIGQAHHLKFKGERGFDFLLDGKNLTKENTVFVIKKGITSIDWINKKKKDGYSFLTVCRNENLYQKFLLMLNLLSNKESIKSLYRIKNYHIIFTLSFIGISVYKNEIESIYKDVNFENFIYSNEDSWKQNLINIYFNTKNTTTWNYSSFIGGSLLYAKNQKYFPRFCHILWSFANGDNFLAVNHDVIEYYKLHHQKIKKYHSIGSIYSEMVKNKGIELKTNESIKRNWIKDNFPCELLPDHKIISFFDTTFIDNSKVLTNFDDAIRVYQEMICLINENKNHLLIVKPSKNEDFFISLNSIWSSLPKGQQVADLWNELKQHPRVYWAGDSADTPMIMAISDVVITHCMSSPTVEALGAGKKAIWYESGKKHYDILYDYIPGLIIHGYSNLLIRLHELLYKISREEYKKYLTKYINNEVLANLDADALDRFIRLLGGK
jgi:polysaccharide biosynthesis PFTS motif protein